MNDFRRFSEQPQNDDAIRYAKRKDIELREATAILGERYTRYYWNRTKNVYHVTEQDKAEAILANGLKYPINMQNPEFDIRIHEPRGGIFFFTNITHAGDIAWCVYLLNPVLIGIKKDALIYHDLWYDNHDASWNLSAMYATHNAKLTPNNFTEPGALTLIQYDDFRPFDSEANE